MAEVTCCVALPLVATDDGIAAREPTGLTMHPMAEARKRIQLKLTSLVSRQDVWILRSASVVKCIQPAFSRWT